MKSKRSVKYNSTTASDFSKSLDLERSSLSSHPPTLLNPLSLFPSKHDTLNSVILPLKPPASSNKLEGNQKWLYTDRISQDFGLSSTSHSQETRVRKAYRRIESSSLFSTPTSKDASLSEITKVPVTNKKYIIVEESRLQELTKFENLLRQEKEILGEQCTWVLNDIHVSSREPILATRKAVHNLCEAQMRQVQGEIMQLNENWRQFCRANHYEKPHLYLKESYVKCAPISQRAMKLRLVKEAADTWRLRKDRDSMLYEDDLSYLTGKYYEAMTRQRDYERYYILAIRYGVFSEEEYNKDPRPGKRYFKAVTKGALKFQLAWDRYWAMTKLRRYRAARMIQKHTRGRQVFKKLHPIIRLRLKIGKKTYYIMCFALWKEYNKICRLIKEALNFYFSSSVDVCLKAWKQYVKDIKQNREKVLAKMVIRTKNASVFQKFIRWQQFTQENRALKRRLRRLFGFPHFDIWCRYVAWNKHIKNLNKRATAIGSIIRTFLEKKRLIHKKRAQKKLKYFAMICLCVRLARFKRDATIAREFEDWLPGELERRTARLNELERQRIFRRQQIATDKEKLFHKDLRRHFKTNDGKIQLQELVRTLNEINASTGSGGQISVAAGSASSPSHELDQMLQRMDSNSKMMTVSTKHTTITGKVPIVLPKSDFPVMPTSNTAVVATASKPISIPHQSPLVSPRDATVAVESATVMDPVVSSVEDEIKAAFSEAASVKASKKSRRKQSTVDGETSLSLVSTKSKKTSKPSANMSNKLGGLGFSTKMLLSPQTTPTVLEVSAAHATSTAPQAKSQPQSQAQQAQPQLQSQTQTQTKVEAQLKVKSNKQTDASNIAGLISKSKAQKTFNQLNPAEKIEFAKKLLLSQSGELARQIEIHNYNVRFPPVIKCPDLSCSATFPTEKQYYSHIYQLGHTHYCVTCDSDSYVAAMESNPWLETLKPIPLKLDRTTAIGGDGDNKIQDEGTSNSNAHASIPTALNDTTNITSFTNSTRKPSIVYSKPTKTPQEAVNPHYNPAHDYSYFHAMLKHHRGQELLRTYLLRLYGYSGVLNTLDCYTSIQEWKKVVTGNKNYSIKAINIYELFLIKDSPRKLVFSNLKRGVSNMELEFELIISTLAEKFRVFLLQPPPGKNVYYDVAHARKNFLRELLHLDGKQFREWTDRNVINPSIFEKLEFICFIECFKAIKVDFFSSSEFTQYCEIAQFEAKAKQGALLNDYKVVRKSIIAAWTHTFKLNEMAMYNKACETVDVFLTREVDRLVMLASKFEVKKVVDKQHYDEQVVWEYNDLASDEACYFAEEDILDWVFDFYTREMLTTMWALPECQRGMLEYAGLVKPQLKKKLIIDMNIKNNSNDWFKDFMSKTTKKDQLSVPRTKDESAITIQKVMRGVLHRNCVRKIFVKTYAKKMDKDTGLPYYCNLKTGESSWERPKFMIHLYPKTTW